jgi:hypothetical protein
MPCALFARLMTAVTEISCFPSALQHAGKVGLLGSNGVRQTLSEWSVVRKPFERGFPCIGTGTHFCVA